MKNSAKVFIVCLLVVTMIVFICAIIAIVQNDHIARNETLEIYPGAKISRFDRHLDQGELIYNVYGYDANGNVFLVENVSVSPDRIPMQ